MVCTDRKPSDAGPLGHAESLKVVARHPVPGLVEVDRYLHVDP